MKAAAEAQLRAEVESVKAELAQRLAHARLLSLIGKE